MKDLRRSVRCVSAGRRARTQAHVITVRVMNGGGGDESARTKAVPLPGQKRALGWHSVSTRPSSSAPHTPLGSLFSTPEGVGSTGPNVSVLAVAYMRLNQLFWSVPLLNGEKSVSVLLTRRSRVMFVLVFVRFEAISSRIRICSRRRNPQIQN